MEENTKKITPSGEGKKRYTSEIVWYSVFGLIWITGLVFAIFGRIAFNVGHAADNVFYQWQKNWAAAWKMSGVIDLRIFGTLVRLVARIGIIIVVNAYTSKAKNEEAKKRRLEERKRILREADQEK